MRPVLGLLAVCVCLVVGCSSDVARVTVKGKVTLDGELIDKGLVEFVPADGKTPSAKGGIILDGQYSAEIVPGEVIVKITSSEVVGKNKMYDTPDSPTIDVLRERIPKKYNEETTLKETIQPGQKELDFKLVTK